MIWDLHVHLSGVPGDRMKKSKKKKLSLPRRTWQINPVTQLKQSKTQSFLFVFLCVFAPLR